MAYKTGGRTQLSCWVDPEDAEWLESTRNALQAKQVGRVTKSDILRDLIRRAQERDLYTRSFEDLLYDGDTGEFRWGPSGEPAGNESKAGYISISINGKKYPAHRLAWYITYGYFPENEIDHINRDPSDNRIANLREVSRQCNARNTGNPSDNRSGVKGVSYCKTNGRWRATIAVDRKNYNLGTYEDLADAACARLAAEQCLDWHGCDSDSPAYRWVKENIYGDIQEG